MGLCGLYMVICDLSMGLYMLSMDYPCFLWLTMVFHGYFAVYPWIENDE